jgi:hypothetical protein
MIILTMLYAILKGFVQQGLITIMASSLLSIFIIYKIKPKHINLSRRYFIGFTCSKLTSILIKLGKLSFFIIYPISIIVLRYTINLFKWLSGNKYIETEHVHLLIGVAGIIIVIFCGAYLTLYFSFFSRAVIFDLEAKRLYLSHGEEMDIMQGHLKFLSSQKVIVWADFQEAWRFTIHKPTMRSQTGTKAILVSWSQSKKKELNVLFPESIADHLDFKSLH